MMKMGEGKQCPRNDAHLRYDLPVRCLVVVHLQKLQEAGTAGQEQHHHPMEIPFRRFRKVLSSPLFSFFPIASAPFSPSSSLLMRPLVTWWRRTASSATNSMPPPLPRRLAVAVTPAMARESFMGFPSSSMVSPFLLVRFFFVINLCLVLDCSVSFC